MATATQSDPRALAERAERLAHEIEDEDTLDDAPDTERTATTRGAFATAAHAVMAAGLVLLFGVLLAPACGLTVREAVTASLEGANAAIVSAARDVDARETAEEAACGPVPACVAEARGRWNRVLEAYDAYRQAWSLLVLAWNRSAPDEAEIAAARANVEATAAAFYAARVAAGKDGGA